MQLKAWEDLKIIDDFLFGKVMRNPDLCKKMLEIILDIKIGNSSDKLNCYGIWPCKIATRWPYAR